MNPIRLHISRRLIPVLLPTLLLLSVPLYAQGTPPTTLTPTASPELFATIENDAFRFESDRAELVPGRPGVVRLTVNFTTTDVPSNTDLISFGLRTTIDDVYSVESSVLDGQPMAPFPTNERRGFSWTVPDSIGSHVLVADLMMLKPVTRADIALTVGHIELRSPAVLKPLSEDTIEQLTAAQQQVTPPAAATTGTATATGTAAPPTMTATAEPSPTPSPTVAPTVETAVAPPPIQPTASPVLPTATPVAPSGGPSERLVPLLLGGLFLLAALAIGGLLLTRRRRPRARRR